MSQSATSVSLISLDLAQKGVYASYTRDDERFPHGYAFFEPLVNGIKGMLVLGVSVMALAGAVQALFTGGRAIAAGVAIAYGLFASIVCWAVALLMRRGAKATHSPLVGADAENWLVNAAISDGGFGGSSP